MSGIRTKMRDEQSACLCYIWQSKVQTDMGEYGIHHNNSDPAVGPSLAALDWIFHVSSLTLRTRAESALSPRAESALHPRAESALYPRV